MRTVEERSKDNYLFFWPKEISGWSYHFLKGKDWGGAAIGGGCGN